MENSLEDAEKFINVISVMFLQNWASIFVFDSLPKNIAFPS
jgi:hypothetical protein